VAGDVIGMGAVQRKGFSGFLVRRGGPEAYTELARHRIVRALSGQWSGMELWNLTSLDVEPHRPAILHSQVGAARVIAINLPAGERLQEHEVHEHAWLHIHHGAVELTDDDGSTDAVTAGGLAHWEPGERHQVVAKEDALLLLLLAPWPGPGHPGAYDA